MSRARSVDPHALAREGGESPAPPAGAGASRRVPGSWLREWQLVLPLILFFLAFILVPLGVLALISVYGDPEMKTMGLGQYTGFFSDGFKINILVQTLWLALRTTLLAIVIGYPLAYVYTWAAPWLQRVLLLLIMLPLLTSVVVRTFAWVVILGRQGIINSALLALGWVDSPLTLLYTPTAVVVALAQIDMPLMVLPLITALTNIDPNLNQASQVLGAGRWRTFLTITLPLSVPGLLAGCLLVFASSAGAFVVQTLIGGGRHLFMPFYIYQQALQVNNFPLAAALAIILLVSVLAIVIVFNIVGRRSRGFVHG
jgi:putative spermidine/putrescine transport system permease protein